MLRALGIMAGATALAAGVIVVGNTAVSGAAYTGAENNGKVKVDRIPVDDVAPDTEPHVGCTFGVDLAGYDQGDLYAGVAFTVQPPTGDWQTVLTDSVFVGEDAGGGATDLDASASYTLDLSGFEEHPQQGHHVKLTITAPLSEGADVKHKVFWVSGCDAPTPTPTPTPTPHPPT